MPAARLQFRSEKRIQPSSDGERIRECIPCHIIRCPAKSAGDDDHVMLAPRPANELHDAWSIIGQGGNDSHVEAQTLEFAGEPARICVGDVAA